MRPSREAAGWLLALSVFLGFVITYRWQAAILVLLLVAAGATYILAQ